MQIKHKFSSAKADSVDTTRVRPTNWNDEHDYLFAAAARLAGRKTAGSGPAEELTISDALDMASAAAVDGAMLARSGGAWGAIANVATHDGDLTLATGSPTTPAAGKVKLAGVNHGGRHHLGVVSPDGVADALQIALTRANIIVARPTAQTNNHTILGSNALTFTGTATARQPAAGNMFTGARRLGLVSATSAGSLAGARIAILQVGRQGGFLCQWRFGVSDAVLVTDARMFAGLQGVTSAPTNVEPSSLTNVLGVGCNAGDTTLQLYAAGSAAQARVNLGANFPVNTLSTDLYEVLIYCPPNGAEVRIQVTRLTTGHVVTTTITNSANLPAITQFLTPQIWRSNNLTGLACGVDWTQLYLESPV